MKHTYMNELAHTSQSHQSTSELKRIYNIEIICELETNKQVEAITIQDF